MTLGFAGAIYRITPGAERLIESFGERTLPVLTKQAEAAATWPCSPDQDFFAVLAKAALINW
jgi:hypothetical protein